MVGKTLSHFRLLDRLGAGGMGVVYRARDEQLGREVALKLLPADSLANSTAQAQLLSEARTASSLNHPNICTVYEVGEADGQTFFAMELVSGRTLAALIPDDGLPAESVIRYGVQIADALADAHAHGVVHRDLKCSNVMITPEGRAKVLDFGLARRQTARELEGVTRSQITLSEAGGLAGTLHYLAPEVLRGEETGVRSDIWALGVVLYEMAAGHRPFAGRTGFELSSAILREPSAPLPATVSAGLRAVIERCLLKDPAQRYQNAVEVRAALEAIGSSTVRLVPESLAAQAGAPTKPATLPAWLRNGIGAALLFAVVILGVREWKAWRARGRLGPIQSLAVLPLENLSNDPAQEYFADGMTEALITNLSKIRALRVISRTSAMQYKHARKPLPEIANELHVDAVVEGSVERSGDRVRIDAQLIQAKEDRSLWANSYERSLSDVLSLQSDVAQAIAGEIRVQLTPQEHAGLSARRTVNPQAYEAYLRGRYLWNKRTPADLRSAMEQFKKAIDRDPTYALAYAGLADGYILLADHGELSPREAMPLGKAAAKKALVLDDSLAEAYASLAVITWSYDWDAAAAEEGFRRALALNPNYATAHQWYGIYLVNVGRFDEGIEEMRRAQELDPLSLIIELNVGRSYYFARRYDQAIEHLQQLEQREPNFWYVRNILGQTYLAMGRINDAIAELERALALSPESERNMGVLGDAYARAGRKAEARRLAENLLALAHTRHFSPAYLAMIYMGLDEKAQAFAWLEKAYADRSDWILEMGVEPEFDLLRSDPRFRELMHRLRPAPAPKHSSQQTGALARPQWHCPARAGCSTVFSCEWRLTSPWPMAVKSPDPRASNLCPTRVHGKTSKQEGGLSWPTL
jgi:serine/threonine-protein kinase